MSNSTKPNPANNNGFGNLPSSVEAEKSVLGALFHHPPSLALIAGILKPADFYSEKNGIVYGAMLDLHGKGEPIDIITVGNLIGDRLANLFGDNDYLLQLMEGISSAAQIAYHARIVADKSTLRRIIISCRKIAGIAMEPAAESEAVAALAVEEIENARMGISHSRAEHIADSARNALKRIEDKAVNGQRSGAETGFCNLDRLTGGLRPQELVIIGARPGMGKTSFALDIALNAAPKIGNVLFFSLEMDDGQLSPRAASFFSRVNLKRTIGASLTMEELREQLSAVKILENVPLFVDFKSDYGIEGITAACHTFNARHKLSMAVIDHLQIVKTAEERYENRNLALGKISRGLKILAKQLGISVIALSQLNRDGDRLGGKDKSPRLSDLRDSGSIEQDADSVWFIHRPGYYDPKAHDISETEIIVAKARSGPKGSVHIKFNPKTASFSDLDSHLCYVGEGEEGLV